jgi:hypothetical protein
MMKTVMGLVLLAAVALGMPAVAGAVCAVEPLAPALKAADTVYVGTIVASTLVQPLEQRHSGKVPRPSRVEVSHEVQADIVLKGDPSTAARVISIAQYQDPKSPRLGQFAETVTLMPGAAVLVVANSAEVPRMGLCSATRKWDAEAAKVVREVFSRES